MSFHFPIYKYSILTYRIHIFLIIQIQNFRFICVRPKVKKLQDVVTQHVSSGHACVLQHTHNTSMGTEVICHTRTLYAELVMFDDCTACNIVHIHKFSSH